MKKDRPADTVSAPIAATLREELEERLREAPDILTLLQSEEAKPLVLARQEDLWVTVRHFMTTTRAEAAVELPDVIAEVIRRQLKLDEGDPIPSSRLAEVKSLNLSGTQVTDAGLAHLKGLAGLQWLSLRGTQVTDAGLAHLKGLAGLQKLSLSDTQVTDAGLAHLKGLAGLQELDLNETRVTDAGLAHLKRLAGLPALYLGGTQVTDAGLAHLKGLGGLRWLSLSRAPVTDAGLTELRKALPKCLIEGP